MKNGRTKIKSLIIFDKPTEHKKCIKIPAYEEMTIKIYGGSGGGAGAFFDENRTNSSGGGGGGSGQKITLKCERSVCPIEFFVYVGKGGQGGQGGSNATNGHNGDKSYLILNGKKIKAGRGSGGKIGISTQIGGNGGTGYGGGGGGGGPASNYHDCSGGIGGKGGKGRCHNENGQDGMGINGGSGSCNNNIALGECIGISTSLGGGGAGGGKKGGKGGTCGIPAENGIRGGGGGGGGFGIVNIIYSNGGKGSDGLIKIKYIPLISKINDNTIIKYKKIFGKCINNINIPPIINNSLVPRQSLPTPTHTIFVPGGQSGNYTLPMNATYLGIVMCGGGGSGGYGINAGGGGGGSSSYIEFNYNIPQNEPTYLNYRAAYTSKQGEDGDYSILNFNSKLYMKVNGGKAGSNATSFNGGSGGDGGNLEYNASIDLIKLICGNGGGGGGGGLGVIGTNIILGNGANGGNGYIFNLPLVFTPGEDGKNGNSAIETGSSSYSSGKGGDSGCNIGYCATGGNGADIQTNQLEQNCIAIGGGGGGGGATDAIIAEQPGNGGNGYNSCSGPGSTPPNNGQNYGGGGGGSTSLLSPSIGGYGFIIINVYTGPRCYLV